MFSNFIDVISVLNSISQLFKFVVSILTKNKKIICVNYWKIAEQLNIRNDILVDKHNVVSSIEVHLFHHLIL